MPSPPSTSAEKDRPTLADIKRWPATVSVEKAATAFGVSRTHAYELVKTGEFPARSIKVGRRAVVLTASILRSLDPESV